MKKTLLLIVGLGVALHLSAQTAAEELAKVLQAMGGIDAVQKWNRLEAEGQFVYAAYNMEINGEFRTVRSGPSNWTKVSLKFGGETYVMIKAYDGKAAWSERMGQVSDLPALNEETMARHGVDLLAKMDVVWTLGKESESEGRKVIGLEAEWRGKKTVFWIDAGTHLVQEISFKDQMISDKEIKEDVDVRVRYGDYQKIDSVMFPMKSVSYQKGRKEAEMRFVKVAFSPKTALALFQRPQQKVDLRYDEEIID